MSINSKDEEKNDDLELVVQTSDGDLHLLGATKEEMIGHKELNLSPLEEINAVSVEDAGSVAALLSLNNGETFPLDIDKEFLEKLAKVEIEERASLNLN